MTSTEVQAFASSFRKHPGIFVFVFSCSRCGIQHQYQAPKPRLVEEQIIDDGWTVSGSGLVCPACSLTDENP